MAQVTLKNSFTKAIPIGTGSPAVVAIPVPSVVTSGTADGASGGGIVYDSTKNFTTLGVQPGFTVMNMTSGLSAIITTVNSSTQITLSQAIGINAGSIYTIYAGGKITGTEWDGALLYNRSSTASGSIVVKALDGQSFTIVIPAGQICPLQVSEVTTNAGSFNLIYALW